MTFKKQYIIDKLINKFGFCQVEGAKHEAYALYCGDCKIATTRFSRKLNSDDISDDILGMMSKELGVNQLGFFKRMLGCTRSNAEYRELLQKNGRMNLP